MADILEAVNRFVWGAPALVMILGVGIWITIRTGFVQVRLFPKAVSRFWGLLWQKDGKDSSFQALCTALGATVGTGNLVGVAGAICIGGPGSIFWMWICSFIGMATKFGEVVLALRYRDPDGRGGPMQIMTRGLGMPLLAKGYALFGLVASFGVGNAAQINAVVTGFESVTGRSNSFWNLGLGILLGALTGILLLGGAGSIGRAAEKLVPFAAAGYILLCLGVLAMRLDALPGAFAAIIRGAFSPRAVTGGIIGSAITALRVGCARGVFTNEAGMGTASIAHAHAQVAHPAEQGLMGIMEVFLDTIVICTLTALVILCSGVPVPYGRDVGGELTSSAFSSVYGSGANWFLTGALCCFAFATLLGWGLYGGRCAQFLFGKGSWRYYAIAQAAVAVLASVMDTETVWQAAEAVNGLMAIPNLLALALLTPEICRLTKELV